MELKFGDDSSDKDSKMKNSIESSESVSEKKQEKNEKKPLKRNVSLLKMLGSESSSQQKEKQPDSEIGILGMIKKASERETENKEKSDKTEKENTVQVESDAAESGRIENEKKVDENSSLEEISEDERTEVVNSYINIGLEDSRQQLSESEPGSIQAAEEVASIAFLESLKNKINYDNHIDEEDIQMLADEISEQISEENNKELSNDENMSESPALEHDISDIDGEVDQEDDPGSNSVSKPGGSTLPTVPVIPPLPPANSGSPIGGGANLPPIGGGGLGSNQKHNIPPQPNPNSTNNQTMEYSINRRRAGDFLVGGIIGYLIGKRRGRIKAESNLLPIQQKLEKQVIGLQSRLYEQEERVRQVAAIKFENKVIIAAPENTQVNVNESKQMDKVNLTDGNKIIEKQEKTIEQTIEYNGQRTIETEQLEKKLSPKSVEIMSLPMILSVAENIKIGEFSLRKLYENGEINQTELREVVKKHLNGERIDEIISEYVGNRVATQEQVKERLEIEDRGGALSNEKEKRNDDAVNNAWKETSNSESFRSDNTIINESEVRHPLDGQDNKPSLAPFYVTAAMAVVVAIILIMLYA
jgi:hypothetical protein